MKAPGNVPQSLWTVIRRILLGLLGAFVSVFIPSSSVLAGRCSGLVFLVWLFVVAWEIWLLAGGRLNVETIGNPWGA